MDIDLDTDPKPELYTIDGGVPGGVLEEYVEWMRRHPLHPGELIADTCECKSLSVAEAAALIGVDCAELTEVVEERAPVTPELAACMEAAGWMRAVVWMRAQSAYDLARERQRLEHSEGIPAAAHAH